jgi:hypothetical protein
MKFPQHVEFKTRNPRQAILALMVNQRGEIFRVQSSEHCPLFIVDCSFVIAGAAPFHNDK